MIDIHTLTYYYPDASRPALSDVTLHVSEGEFVAVSGPSGCGKSTLALAIGGYLHHQFGGELDGMVRVAGLDVGEHSLFEVADVVGLVQQNPENQFCTLTVRDEVAFGLENRCLPPATIASLCDEALDIVGAAHLADRDLATLSGGEKQRVAVASMLASRPRVIVFDEPTSNLDPTATARILGVLDAVRRQAGLTILVIEHKLDALRPFAPRLIRMEGGRIVADGEELPPAEPIVARQPNPAGEALARLKGLGVDYDGVPSLEGVSLTLYAGQLVALMGDNGSGKSTLLRCLMGLIPPTRGSVIVLGHSTAAGAQLPRCPLRRRGRNRGTLVHVAEDPRSSGPRAECGAPISAPCASSLLSVSALVRDVGFIFQNPDHQLLGDTVWDDALLLARNLGCQERVAPSVGALLAEAGLADRRDDHPFRLSYGQKRRLNVVAATAHEPRLVLADEVLIGQDPSSAAWLMDRLRAMANDGACVLLALHDPRVALRYADRLVFLDAGRLVADDAPRPALDRLATLGYGAYTVTGAPSMSSASGQQETSPRASAPAAAATAGLAARHPLLKLAWLLAITAAAFVLQAPAQVAGLLGLVLLLVALGRVDVRRVRLRGLLLWSTLFLLLLQALFYRQGEPLFYLWPFGEGRWPVTMEGLGRGVRVASRFAVIVLSSQLFVITTDPGALAYALMRAGLPYRYGFALVTALRLVPIFRTEATTVYQAQLVRGVRYDADRGHPGYTVRRLVALLRQFMLPLLISALRKVDALAVSMEGRQFGRYAKRSYLRRAEWRRGDSLGAAALVAFLMAVTWLAILSTG